MRTPQQPTERPPEPRVEEMRAALTKMGEALHGLTSEERERVLRAVSVLLTGRAEP